MSVVVAKKEFVELTRDRRLLWMATIVWLLFAAALATAWPEQHRRSAERDALRAEAREHWLAQGVKNPHTAAHFGVYAIKPHTPLTIFDPGVTTYVGTHVLLEAHWQNPLQGRAADAAPASYRLAALSPATILQQLLPLVIIVAGYSAIAGERERGTWRLLLAQGTTAAAIGTGKLLALVCVLAALVIPVVIVGALSAAATAPTTGDVLVRGAILAAAYSAYGVTYVAVTLWASAGSSSSRRALTILLAFWILSTLILPRAAADVSRAIYPTPSAFAFHESLYTQKAQGLDGHDAADARVDALRTRTLETYGVARVEDLPLNFSGVALQADEEYGNALFDAGYGALAQTFDRQAWLQRLAGVIAPVQALRLTSMALAGTDMAHDRDFARRAEAYRRQLVGAMNDDLTRQSRTGDFSYVGDRGTWASVAAFSYTMPTAFWTLRGEWLSCGLLVIWCGASLTALYLALKSPRAVEAA